MQPTEEQIKELWKWCGFEFRKDWSEHQPYKDPDGVILQHDTPIDLNNLFKWGIDPNEYITEVSFVKGECQIATRGLNNKGVQYFTGKDEDRALALFWAIDKVREAENED